MLKKIQTSQNMIFQMVKTTPRMKRNKSNKRLKNRNFMLKVGEATVSMLVENDLLFADFLCLHDFIFCCVIVMCVVDDAIYVKPFDGPSHRPDPQADNKKEENEKDDDDDEGKLKLVDELLTYVNWISINLDNVTDFHSRWMCSFTPHKTLDNTRLTFIWSENVENHFTLVTRKSGC